MPSTDVGFGNMGYIGEVEKGKFNLSSSKLERVISHFYRPSNGTKGGEESLSTILSISVVVYLSLLKPGKVQVSRNYPQRSTRSSQA